MSLAGKLLPGEVLSDIAGAAEIDCRKSRAPAGADHLVLWVVGEIAEELELHSRTGHGAAPAPPLRVIGVELHPFERPLDPAEIRIGIHVGDEEYVDVCCAEVNRNDAVISREDLWHEASEYDEEDRLLTGSCRRRTSASSARALVARERGSSMVGWILRRGGDVVEWVDELLLDVICGVLSACSKGVEIPVEAWWAYHRDLLVGSGEA